MKKDFSKSASSVASLSRERHRLAILASGSGSNAQQFINYFRGHHKIEVALIISNNPDAYVLSRASDSGVPTAVIGRSGWANQEAVRQLFASYRIDAIVLAGYLLLIPSYLIEMFPCKIFNIHPALLPAFGGKGMYGMHVHRAVIESGRKQSGITIHLVNEAYDEGEILYQAKLDVLPGDTPESLAGRVLELEHLHYPRVVEGYLSRQEG